MGACRHAETVHRFFKNLPALWRQPTVLEQVISFELCITESGSCELNIAGILHARGNIFTGFARWRTGPQTFFRRTMYGHMNIYAVKQWPRDLAAVISYALSATAAVPARVPEIAARTWVHRGDELKLRREFCLAPRAGNRDIASIGSRSDSSTRRLNSGNSSRNRTPLCARDISPGLGSVPPPTRAAADAVWCGALNGRTRHSRRSISRPSIE